MEPIVYCGRRTGSSPSCWPLRLINEDMQDSVSHTTHL